MKRIIITLLVVTAIIATATSSSDATIKRVASRYNIMNFYGGYADPHGEYDQSGLVYFEDNQDNPYDIKGDSLYNPTYYLGIDYGTLYGRHILYMIGFRFTEHSAKDWLFDEINFEYKLRQYDIEFNANYYLLDLVESPWSPYIGAGVQSGFTTYSVKGFDNDSQLKFAFSLNLGFDIKLFQAPNKRSYVTLASMNNYNLLASDNRPKYLNVGLGLRYFFR